MAPRLSTCSTWLHSRVDNQLLQCSQDRLSAPSSSPWTSPSPISPSPRAALVEESFSRAIAGRRRAHARPRCPPDRVTVSNRSAAFVFVSSRKESSPAPPQLAHGRRFPSASPPSSSSIPATTNLPRARCPPLRVPGEQGHLLHLSVVLPVPRIPRRH